ncbi:hypothetical protein FHR22_002055 [Sphingopyxis panaciterrae]|nr:hypothetical protein [Sphingopyxis panaciterrae]
MVGAVTVRNLCAHGIPVFNQNAVNRITQAAGRTIARKNGVPIKLDKKRFAAYTETPRSFARDGGQRHQSSRRGQSRLTAGTRPCEHDPAS